MAGRTVTIKGIQGRELQVPGVPDDVSQEEVERYAREKKLLPEMIQSGSGSEKAVRFSRVQQALSEEDLGILRHGEAGSGSSAEGLGGMFSELKTRFWAGRPTRELVEERVGSLMSGGVSEDNILIVRPDYKDRPEDVAILFKPVGKEDGPWVELNTPGEYGLGDAADLLSKFLSIGGITSAAASMAPIGAAGRLMTTGAAAAGGHALESELDPLERTPREGVYKQAATEGMFASAFDAPFEVMGVGKAARGLTAKGTRWAWEHGTSLPSEITNLNAASKALWDIQGPGGGVVAGIPPITITDVNPILTSMRNMAIRSGTHARALHLERLEAVANRITKERDKLARGGGGAKAVQRMVDKWEQDLLGTLNTPIRGDTVATADTVEDAINTFINKRFERQAKLDAVANTRAVEDNVVYNLAPYELRVDAMHRGVVGNLRKPDVPAGAPELLVAQGGAPASVAKATQGIETLHAPKGELATVMDKFLRLDRELGTLEDGGRYFSSRTQLLALRERALKFVDRDDPMADEVAGEFLGILDKILANPVNPTRASTRAAREAVNYRKGTERVTRGLQTRELLRGLRHTPERVGEDLINPGSPDRIKQLRHIFYNSNDEAGWRQVVEGYTSKLIRKPADIEKELSKYSEPIRRLMYSEADEAILHKFSREWVRFQDEPFVRLAKEQQRMGREAVEAILSGDLAQIELVVTYAGRKNSSINRSLQAGIYQYLIDQSYTMEMGKTVLRPQAAMNTILQLKKSGKLGRIMTERQVKMLDNFAETLSAMPADAGVGEAMQAALISSGAFPYSPHKIPKAIQSWLLIGRNAMFGRLFMDDAAARYLDAMVGAQKPLSKLRMLSVAMGTVWADAQKDAAEVGGKMDERLPGADQEIMDMLRGGGQAGAPWDLQILGGPGAVPGI